ncbi:hypothetical protein FLJU110815_20245 [Flavobacterium jumunjinense]
MKNEKIIKKYTLIIILLITLVAISGILGDTHIPYIIVIILGWIYIFVLYFFENKKK